VLITHKIILESIIMNSFVFFFIISVLKQTSLKEILFRKKRRKGKRKEKGTFRAGAASKAQ
jgi:hypothetical protein